MTHQYSILDLSLSQNINIFESGLTLPDNSIMDTMDTSDSPQNSTSLADISVEDICISLEIDHIDDNMELDLHFLNDNSQLNDSKTNDFLGFEPLEIDQSRHKSNFFSHFL